jgi:hypothetical protein
MINKILSSFLTFVLIGSNIHLIDSTHLTKVDDYSICSVDCEHNEHSASYNDCDVCNKKVREDFIVFNNESLINGFNNLFFDNIEIINSDNSHGLFDSRAPPSNIS